MTQKTWDFCWKAAFDLWFLRQISIKRSIVLGEPLNWPQNIRQNVNTQIITHTWFKWTIAHFGSLTISATKHRRNEMRNAHFRNYFPFFDTSSEPDNDEFTVKTQNIFDEKQYNSCELALIHVHLKLWFISLDWHSMCVSCLTRNYKPLFFFFVGLLVLCTRMYFYFYHFAGFQVRCVELVVVVEIFSFIRVRPNRSELKRPTQVMSIGSLNIIYIF